MAVHPDSDDFSAFLASRRSTRDFLPTPVSEEIIHEIIADGLTAPSWSNTRPFLVAVATGDVRNRISEEFLRRWDAVKDFQGAGIRGKIKACKSGHTENVGLLKIIRDSLIENN